MSEEPSGNKRRSLTTGDVRRQLFGLALPMVIGIVSIAAFNVVDTFFVSMLGARHLAAISFTFPVVTIVGSIALGLGVGTTSVLSRAIGSGDESGVRRIATDSLLLGVATVLVLSVVGYLTIDPLFSALGADGETLALVHDYMSVWYLGVTFIVVPMMGNAAIRATGDTRTPAAIMVFAGVINAILDPIFIFVLDLGIQGAALATVVGRASTLMLSLWVLARRERMLALPSGRLSVLLDSWREVLRIGLPTAGANLAVPFSIAVVTAILAREGDNAVAAFGAGTRVELLALIPGMALGAGLAPLVGQNFGAGHADRVRLAVRTALTWAALAGGASFLVLAAGSSFIGRAFTDDDEVTRLIGTFLLIAPVAHAFYGFFMTGTSTFNALGMPARAATLSILRAPVLVVGLVWLGAELYGPVGVFVGHASANLLAGVAALAWLWFTLREDTSAATAVAVVATE